MGGPKPGGGGGSHIPYIYTFFSVSASVFFFLSVTASVPPKSPMAYFHFQSAFAGIPGLFSCFGPTNFGPSSDSDPGLKRWGSPRRQRLCSHWPHLWATFDSFPRCDVLGTLQAAGVM